ncbi:hypothetical protein [Paraburkholderia sp. 22B1P]
MRSLTDLLTGYTILITGDSRLTTLVSLRMIQAELSRTCFQIRVA